jgi:50S ribosomal protein L16 3-hydroxylase
MKNLTTLLGGMSAEQFLREYWQKKPLLIRQAIPDFNGLLSRDELIALACEGDAQARLIKQQRNRFTLQNAPFFTDDFDHLEKSKWTVLVQGLNHHLASGAELLKQFNFIPHARLDDLMVSFAPKGGGVGPHFDSYDVFLLQGAGHRRWQISAQADRTLIEDAPLRILRDFKVEQEWLLAPGDMLYLPPHYAHNGIAEDDCMTYSIGFRTPAYQELAEQFLVYLQDSVCAEGMYADPELTVQKHPAEIGAAMLAQVTQKLNEIRWDEDDVAQFLGCYLSEPKAHIFFDAPTRAMKRDKFTQALATQGITLNLKTQMLCHGSSIFINGEAIPCAASDYKILRELADHRQLGAENNYSATLLDLIFEWYSDGFLQLNAKEKNHGKPAN